MTDSVRIPEKCSIRQALATSAVTRRGFLRFCAALAVAAPAGLALTENASAAGIAGRIAQARRPSVIWLHFQDCTGCTESLLHAADPDVAELLFDLISLDYHETLMAASGYQAEAALAGALRANRGNYVLVVEGAVPTGEGAGFARIAGRNALDAVREAAEGAAFVVAMGSCAAWGGVASAAPNPSHASGLSEVITGKPIVNLPGCPPNPTTLLAVLLEHAAMHRLPALDKAGRPRFAYDRLIHEDCPRRGHFDAGRFATAFGDEGHRAGWCLYKLGCKGPMTHASCSLRHFNGAANAWPIGIGAPCVGCTEQQVGFRIPLFQLADLHAATPPEALPPVAQPVHASQTAAELAVGALLGAGGTAAWFLSRKLPAGHAQTEENESENLEDPSDADVEKSEAPADEREKRP